MFRSSTIRCETPENREIGCLLVRLQIPDSITGVCSGNDEKSSDGRAKHVDSYNASLTVPPRISFVGDEKTERSRYSVPYFFMPYVSVPYKYKADVNNTEKSRLSGCRKISQGPPLITSAYNYL